MRCWACAAGALGERKPDVVSMDPSWHHNYASLAWIGGNGEAKPGGALSSIKPELVELTTALHGLAHDAGMRGNTWPTPAPLPKIPAPPDQREALIKLDEVGAHDQRPPFRQHAQQFWWQHLDGLVGNSAGPPPVFAPGTAVRAQRDLAAQQGQAVEGIGVGEGAVMS